MKDSKEFPCTDDPEHSTIVSVNTDEGFVSIELEFLDGCTNMTLLSIDDAKELRDFLNEALAE
jgi:hypothetical protein